MPHFFNLRSSTTCGSHFKLHYGTLELYEVEFYPSGQLAFPLILRILLFQLVFPIELLCEKFT